MARIRTVKPELFTHELLYDLELNYNMPIRLAFIGLFTQCDREGRFKWRPRTLKAGILPHDNLDFNFIMNIFLDHRLIDQYQVDGGLYGYIPTWDKHQFINNRESKSQIPNPPGFQPVNTIFQPRVEHASTTCEARVEYASSTPLYFTQGEGNGKEGKGKEGKGKEYICEVSPETPPVSFEQDSIVLEIFNYWQSVMFRTKSKLDVRRQKKIETALKIGYTPDQLKQAIDGCFMTPHNMGTNPQGKKYNDIELIFRDASNIERFMQNIEIINQNTVSSVSQIDQIFEGAI